MDKYQLGAQVITLQIRVLIFEVNTNNFYMNNNKQTASDPNTKRDISILKIKGKDYYITGQSWAVLLAMAIKYSPQVAIVWIIAKSDLPKEAVTALSNLLTSIF